MNNEKYNQIIDKAYEEYFFKIKTSEGPSNENDVKSRSFITDTQGTGFHSCETFTKKEFINKCKADSEFSKRWGLEIVETELSLEERHWLYCKSFEGTDDNHKGSSNSEQMTEYHNKRNIPTKLITITYNNETIESYE